MRCLLCHLWLFPFPVDVVYTGDDLNGTSATNNLVVFPLHFPRCIMALAKPCRYVWCNRVCVLLSNGFTQKYASRCVRRLIVLNGRSLFFFFLPPPSFPPSARLLYSLPFARGTPAEKGPTRFARLLR